MHHIDETMNHHSWLGQQQNCSCQLSSWVILSFRDWFLKDGLMAFHLQTPTPTLAFPCDSFILCWFEMRRGRVEKEPQSFYGIIQGWHTFLPIWDTCKHFHTDESHKTQLCRSSGPRAHQQLAPLHLPCSNGFYFRLLYPFCPHQHSNAYKWTNRQTTWSLYHF